jgi:hypothetical protein
MALARVSDLPPRAGSVKMQRGAPPNWRDGLRQVSCAGAFLDLTILFHGCGTTGADALPSGLKTPIIGWSGLG